MEETQICSLPAVVGPCRARLQKWYYEPALSRCTTFFYGGCDGNENRFDTEQQCQAKCEKTAYDVNGGEAILEINATLGFVPIKKLKGTFFRAVYFT